jgi:hypothetical protein
VKKVPTSNPQRRAKKIPTSESNTLTPQTIVEACNRLARKGYRREVEEFLAICRPDIEADGTAKWVDDKGVTEVGKWVFSLLLWDRYLLKLYRFEESMRIFTCIFKYLRVGEPNNENATLCSRISWLNQATEDWHRGALAATSRVVKSLNPAVRSFRAANHDSGDAPD